MVYYNGTLCSDGNEQLYIVPWILTNIEKETNKKIKYYKFTHMKSFKEVKPEYSVGKQDTGYFWGKNLA